MNPANPQNGKLPAIAAIGVMGLALYWTFTYTGPFRYLAELQLKWFGSYSPKLTLMLVMLALLGVAGLIKLIFRGAERPAPSLPNAAVSVPAPSPAPSSFPNAAVATVVQPLAYYVRFVVAVVLFGFGVWSYSNGTQAGSLQELNASDFQNGDVHSRIVYANVRGRLSEMYVGENHYLYIPMFGETQGKAPVQLLVGVNENQTQKYLRKEADGSFTVRGVADKGLPGDIKYAFEKNGVPVGDSVWVVHSGREPGSDRQVGLILMAAGILLGGVIFAIDSYRKKKNAAARPLQALA
jgi:hypothetical protein